jgi:hypothetical protein
MICLFHGSEIGPYRARLTCIATAGFLKRIAAEPDGFC